ncbi:FecR family protein [Chitinophaga costaii]|uniref:FecR family protein n=1 Tax=Chitinophaga costaii TaxID=1335309 RepID=A0A1C4FL68_9BACT|nr:FecR family protein [Chitinophaga costaii]SCC56596.1 FecR family protein [Chitinophaga costaii]
MEKSEIEQLVQRYARHECTPAEWLQLLSIMEAGEHDAELQQAIKQVWAATTAQDMPATIHKEALYAQLEPLLTPPLVVKQRRSWMAAAAVVAGLLLAGYAAKQWLLPTRQAVVAQRPNLPPGHNGAVLTLANGQQIVLDSAANGPLARQGNTQLMHQNGQLIYKPEGPATATAYNIVTTPRARQYQLVLPDGSRVWLNAASSIRYPVAFHGQRSVEITGEAYFEIAPQAGAPFTVTAHNMEIAVLGTHFNVNAYEDEASAKTTLTEGAVKVSTANNTLLLHPGQQSILHAGAVTLVQHADVQSALAWKDGLFSYNGERLEPIMRQIARWYNVDVVFKDKIEEEFVATIPRDVPISQVLELLEATEHVHFSMQGKVITVAR